MFVCRLFHRDQPFEQVDARFIADGQMTLGRDPSADWTLADPEGVLSRIHCTLAVEGGTLTLRDSSTNGSWLDDGSRAPRDVAVPIAPRQAVKLGAFTLLVDRPPQADDGAALSSTTLAGAGTALPSDWIDAVRTPAGAAASHRDASLLEAFCEGARLDASAFSGEDPVELMKRLGAIYQQTVIGLAGLLAERSRIKGAHHLERTTIGAADNNPFKWTASRRLAQDLLCARPQGYLSAVDAVRASFVDVTAHCAAVVDGAREAVDAAAAHLAPEAIASEAAAAGFSLRGKAAACWDVHGRRHAALGKLDGDGIVAAAFRDGYSRAGLPRP